MYIQLYFVPGQAHKDFTEITNQTLSKKLLQFYDLENSEFKVPIILGALVDNWKKTLPMIFITHYAQFLTLPHTKMDQTVKKLLIKHITTSCRTNEDFIKKEYHEQHEKFLKNAKSPKKRLQI